MVAAPLVAMFRDEIPITTPCGASFDGMSAVDGRRRMCASCNKVVHDLSAMSEEDARVTVSDGPVCVRYLYDVHGNVLFSTRAAGPRARVVPAGALLSKAAKSKWLRAAAVAASAIVFEACGGADGGERPYANEPNPTPQPTTTPLPPPRVNADAAVRDASDDADDGGADAATDEDGG